MFVEEGIQGQDPVRLDEVVALVESAHSIGRGDHQIVEHPMKLNAATVGGGDAGNSRHPPQQDPKEMGSTHVCVKDVDSAILHAGRDSTQFVGRPTMQIGADHFESLRAGLFGDPRVRSAKEHDLVTSLDQSPSKKQAVGGSCASIEARGDLQDLHAAAAPNSELFPLAIRHLAPSVSSGCHDERRTAGRVWGNHRPALSRKSREIVSTATLRPRCLHFLFTIGSLGISGREFSCGQWATVWRPLQLV